ncbi:Protein STR-86 [Aphelenchoides avenae]|nr:Protein STR-86 [Aphelenchus avenae]
MTDNDILSVALVLFIPSQNLFQKYPLLQPILDAHNCAPIPLWDPRAMYICGAIVIFEVSVIMTVCVLLVYLIFRALDERKHAMSVKTHRMHKQLTLALILQLITPGLTLALPFMILVVLALLQADVSTETMLTMQVFGLHSPLNTLLMVAVVAPYRTAVTNFFRRALRIKPADTEGGSSVQMTQSSAHLELSSSLPSRRSTPLRPSTSSGPSATSYVPMRRNNTARMRRYTSYYTFPANLRKF